MSELTYILTLMNGIYLVMVVHSFDQYRIINFLYFPAFSFFNFINVSHTKRGVATKMKNHKFMFLNRVQQKYPNELTSIYLSVEGQ